MLAARQETSSRSTRSAQNFEPIGPHRLEPIDEDFAVDDGGSHVGAAGGVDDGGAGVAVRDQVWTVAVDHDQVRTLARLERPDLSVEAERLGAAARGHPERVARRQRAWTASRR